MEYSYPTEANMTGRDDWKYDEDMLEDSEQEEAEAPKEKHCVYCLHVVPVEAPYCPWCGKQLPEPRKPPATRK